MQENFEKIVLDWVKSLSTTAVNAISERDTTALCQSLTDYEHKAALDVVAELGDLAEAQDVLLLWDAARRVNEVRRDDQASSAEVARAGATLTRRVRDMRDNARSVEQTLSQARVDAYNSRKEEEEKASLEEAKQRRQEEYTQAWVSLDRDLRGDA